MKDDLQGLKKHFMEEKKKLADLDFILYGTIRKHFMVCGNRGCRCHAKPPQLHGPYYDWTRKVDGKTKTVRLTEEHAKILGKWIENMRGLEKIISSMEKISVQAASRKIKK